MRVRMREAAAVLVPALVLAQAVLVRSAASAERPPAPPDFSRFPSEFARWTMLQQSRIEPDVEAQLRADQLLSRTYASRGAVADLFVAWFRSQSAGASQPHSPKVCLPGSGWTTQSTDDVTISSADGDITVNRYVVSQGAGRAVVLYWYQTPRRVIASEWSAKFWVIADAVRDHRTDTALVRIVVWSAPGRDEAASNTARQFAADLYPTLRRQLPL
jgi:EpsI family protein